MKRWKRVAGLLAMVAFLVAVGCVTGLVALNRYLDPFDDQPFSSAAWAVADSRGRAPMARDAIRQLPMGIAQERVRELLGEPQPVKRDPRGSVDVYGNRLLYPETWTYYLGSWSGVGPHAFDDAFLYVHFDSKGKVIAAEVTGG